MVQQLIAVQHFSLGCKATILPLQKVSLSMADIWAFSVILPVMMVLGEVEAPWFIAKNLSPAPWPLSAELPNHDKAIRGSVIVSGPQPRAPSASFLIDHALVPCSDGGLMVCSFYSAINLFIGHLPTSLKRITGPPRHACVCVWWSVFQEGQWIRSTHPTHTTHIHVWSKLTFITVWIACNVCYRQCDSWRGRVCLGPALQGVHDNGKEIPTRKCIFCRKCVWMLTAEWKVQSIAEN